jgi:hypothetical protein
VRAVFQDIVATDHALIHAAIFKELRATPPKSFPYLQLAAAYIDGKPADKLQVRNYGRLTDDDLVLLETVLARAAGEGGEVPRNPLFHRPAPRAELEQWRANGDAVQMEPDLTDSDD